MAKISNKTLLFTLEYPPQIGGVANYYGNLVKYWPDDIFVLTDSSFCHPERSRGIYSSVSSRNIETSVGMTEIRKNLTKPHWLFSLWRLRREIKKNKIDTVLVGQILPLGTVTWLLAKFLKFDYVVFLHGMDFTFARKSARKRWLTRKILSKTKKVVAANSYVGKLAGDFLKDQAKIIIVNPGVDTQVESQKLKVKSLVEKYNLKNKKVLLQVGRLVERKGVDKVLEVLPDVLREVPELIYVIVGTGQCPVHTDIKNIILISDADDEELNAWYELCDIFIMPSRNIKGDFEGFGIVYLEANLHGKPVIAGDSGGVRDAVVNNVNGLLVNPESTTEIKNAIIKLCKDEGLANKLGQQGKERAIKDFNWEKQIASIKF